MAKRTNLDRTTVSSSSSWSWVKDNGDDIDDPMENMFDDGRGNCDLDKLFSMMVDL